MNLAIESVKPYHTNGEGHFKKIDNFYINK